MKKVILIASVIILIVVCVVAFNNSRYDNYGGEQCPKCKSTDIGTFFYGLYKPLSEDSTTLAQVEEGVLVPGGCIIRDSSPKYRCSDCYFTWGKFLSNINKD